MNLKEEFESLKYYDVRLKRAFFEFSTRALFNLNKKLIKEHPYITIKDHKYYNEFRFCTEYDWNYIKNK